MDRGFGMTLSEEKDPVETAADIVEMIKDRDGTPENEAIIRFMRSATFHRIIEDPDMCKLEDEELLALYHAEGKQ